MRCLSGVVAAAVLSVGLGGAAWARRAAPAAGPVATKSAALHATALEPKALPPALLGAPPLAASAEETRFSRLAPLEFSSANLHRSLSVRLYDHDGRVDEAAASELDNLLADARDPEQIEVCAIQRRTLQLVAKAAYHFRSTHIEVVSAYRKPRRRREGPHGRGDAVDFKLEDVPANLLAAYLRTQPRVGVGIYTHPKTQFVHLDVREQSFHWLDASPPGKHWRERSIGGKTAVKRDATYVRGDDWPEGTEPPAAINSP
jgi:uncharacterized protein YcbK (DUF882 family)